MEEIVTGEQAAETLEERPAEAPEEKPVLSGEELYRAVMADEGVRARVLSDYLGSLKGVPLMGGSGTGVTAPATKPKSFAEAGCLALGYLKNKK